MLFDDKKLQLESIYELIQCPVQSIEPYALMLAPVYVLMKLNEKLVSVKAPLDFFTEEELRKLRSHEVFYLPKFVRSSIRFQTAARLMQNLLTSDLPQFSAAPYEVSKESLSMLGELWGKQMSIEPFFMCVFTDELCGTLDPQRLLWAREHAVTRHDHGLLLSGMAVFIALHLGWFDLKFLNFCRTSVYERTAEGETWERPKTEFEFLVSDLNRILKTESNLNMAKVSGLNGEWARKLFSRLLQMKDGNFAKHDSVSIHDAEGFAA